LIVDAAEAPTKTSPDPLDETDPSPVTPKTDTSPLPLEESVALSDEPPTVTSPDPLELTLSAPDTATSKSRSPEPSDVTENDDASSPVEEISPELRLVIEASASFGTVTTATTDCDPVAGLKASFWMYKVPSCTVAPAYFTFSGDPSKDTS